MDIETRAALVSDLAVALLVIESIETAPAVPDDLRQFTGVALRRLRDAAMSIEALQDGEQLPDLERLAKDSRRANC